MKDLNGEMGVCYRSLQIEAENLEALWAKGEVRLAPETIKYKVNGLREIAKLGKRISIVLDKFSGIALKEETPVS